MHELHTEIEIEASAQRIWSILTDFASYPQWNPFIRQVRGLPVAGSSLEVRIQAPGGRGMTFHPTVLVVEPARELRWLGRFLMRGLFDGEHRFVIEPLPDGRVRFRQSERFSGLLVPLFRSSLERDTKRGFAAMNAALKQQAQGRPSVRA